MPSVATVPGDGRCVTQTT